MLQGKGWYIWKIAETEGGNIDKIVQLAASASLTHVLVKIADGRYSYNADKLPALTKALKAAGIQVWGWQYTYGYSPASEAMAAAHIVQAQELDGFVVNAEVEYKAAGGAAKAKSYMQTLRAILGNALPIGLSTYRWPTYHREFPFNEFLEKCDFAMPQVYWMQAHNPASQLQQTIREYAGLNVKRPVFPTGACFLERGWKPTYTEVAAFIEAAKVLNLQGVNFWEWANARRSVQDGWEVIRSTSWINTPVPEPVVQPGLSMRVLVDGLRMRSAPSLSAAVLGSLVLGDVIRIVNVSGSEIWGQLPDGKWVAVTVGGKVYLELVK